MPPALSIVIPAYREAAYLARTLAEVRAFLDARGRLATTEVICVTADADDDTPAIAAAALVGFPHARHVQPGAKVGKGRDVRAGMLAATGDLVMFMDADLATPLHHVDRVLDAFARDPVLAVAIGVRDLRHIHADWLRSASSQLANELVRRLLVPGVRDTQCGFKAFRRGVVADLFEPLVALGWGFDFEVLARAQRAGLRIQQLPLGDWADPKGDAGLVGEVPWRATLRTLRELAAVWRTLRR